MLHTRGLFRASNPITISKQIRQKIFWYKYNWWLRQQYQGKLYPSNSRLRLPCCSIFLNYIHRQPVSYYRDGSNDNKQWMTMMWCSNRQQQRRNLFFQLLVSIPLQNQISAFCNIEFLRPGNVAHLLNTWALYPHHVDSFYWVRRSWYQSRPPLGKY